MNRARLHRFCSATFGTFGLLSFGDGQALYTVERPWLGNAPNVSCIPQGVYKCGPQRYNKGDGGKGYDAIGVRDVPGRSLILIHRANLPTDVEGCIGVGTKVGAIDGKWAVLGSAEAFARLMDELGGKEFELEITGPPED